MLVYCQDMFNTLLTLLILSVISGVIATNVDFANSNDDFVIKNDDDVEVKQTIVFSTKLKNNRRGIETSNDGDTGVLTYNIGNKNKPGKVDVPDVPVIKAYKAVETTNLRPRHDRFIPKRRVYPDVFVNRNIRDGYDIYPNLVAQTPNAWKPSSVFNNINWWNDNNDNKKSQNEFVHPVFYEDKTVNIFGKANNDGMKEFYCRRCRELSREDEARKSCFSGRTDNTPFTPLQPPWGTTSTSTTTSSTARTLIDRKLAEFS